MSATKFHHSSEHCVQRWSNACRARLLPRLVITRAKSDRSALLYWAAEKHPLYEQLPVAINLGEYGRCLVAQRDIQPDEVIVSVCTERVFTSQASNELDMHWAAEMAVRLLQARHACQQTEKGAISGATPSSDRSDSFWRPWIDSLPQRPVTPVEFTEHEVQQLVFPNAVQAVLNMRTCLEDCYKELQPQLQQIDCGWRDFLWAVQVLHSRCFFECTGGRHLAVPGIDMCNHSSTAANARVRMLNSPAACQGLTALQEVAPAAAAAAQEVTRSYFQLVAGPEGIPAGEQVSISYGSWPAEPFLLLFGFVPQPNPEDCIILFDSLPHMASCYLKLLDNKEHISANGPTSPLVNSEGFRHVVMEYVRDAEQQQQQQQQQQEEADLGPSPGYRFMFVGQSGMDGRLNGAMQVLHQAVAAAAAAAAGAGDSSILTSAPVRQMQLPVGDLIVYRLEQLIEKLQDSIHELQQQQQQQTHSAAAAAPEAAQQQQQQQQQVDGEITYHASSDHTALILSYCSSKAALAQHMLSNYSDPVSMMIAAGASRR